MMGKLLSSEIAQRKLINSAADNLHFYRSITRFINSGSMCTLGCLGTYKLLRGYPPSPLLVNVTSPSPIGEGFLFICLLKQLYFIC